MAGNRVQSNFIERDLPGIHPVPGPKPEGSGQATGAG